MVKNGKKLILQQICRLLYQQLKARMQDPGGMKQFNINDVSILLLCSSIRFSAMNNIAIASAL